VQGQANTTTEESTAKTSTGKSQASTSNNDSNPIDSNKQEQPECAISGLSNLKRKLAEIDKENYMKLSKQKWKMKLAP
jgi:hypothetical protein